jgi:plastocyanin
MNKRMTMMAPLAALALVLTGCGGNGGDADGNGGGAITIVATEFEFDPADVSIPADTATDITIDNQGVVEHDWTIDELDVEIYADPGESVTQSITAAAGTYEVYCSIPGHREAGMVGTLTVGD